MNSKQRVHAALEGRPVDRYPVAASYTQLYHLDHFAELSGLAECEMGRWLVMTPQEHIRVYRRMIEAAPFDILQPQWGPQGDPGNVEFVERGGAMYRHDKREDKWTLLAAAHGGHARDYAANETQHVFDRKDIDDRVRTPSSPGEPCAYVRAVVEVFGADHFILTGGVIGTLYSSHHHVGLTNLLSMLVEQPYLIDHLSRRILDQNIRSIRMLAAAGGDAIYIDDAMSTCDMISPAMYERFSLPYVTEMVREIHRLGHKAILIYFGGVMDRLEQIASTGAAALCMECSMKNYANDIGEAAKRIGGRMTLYSNIDPVGVLQNGSDEELAAEIRRQVAAGRTARGFVISPASPITPATPLSRVRRFIRLSQAFGAGAP